MLPVRHLDSSASLCRWQRASLWWNNGANCPWWTGDQTSASKIHELEMFIFGAKQFLNVIGGKKREIEESTQRSSFKIWFYQTVLFHTSIVLWHLVIPCDMAGCETIWLDESHNSSNFVAEASTGTFHSHIDTARPLKHPNWGKLQNSNTQKIHGNGCKWCHVESLCVMWYLRWKDIYFFNHFSQISFHRGNPSLKWGRTFQPRHQRQLIQALHPTELPCDAGNQHPP